MMILRYSPEWLWYLRMEAGRPSLAEFNSLTSVSDAMRVAIDYMGSFFIKSQSKRKHV